MNHPKSRGKLGIILAATLVLSGCGTSPPPRYHALSLPAEQQASGRARMLVEILPIALPERLNREEMVLTGESGQLDVRENDRWAAALPDEIRQIVTDTLWRTLWAADVYRVPVPVEASAPQYRLALRIERFEAIPGKTAQVEGSWTARRLPRGAPVVCRANFTIALPGRTPEAAAAALAVGAGQLALALADSLGGLTQDKADTCAGSR
ncbi:MAG: PqiC family protein [Phaeospirillum sp.]|nr:PqiC family protein [Phaeospirillum sp.]